MTVETATYISQLNSALPAGTDPKSEGDDHVRLLKASLKATFPNFGAAALQASNAQLDKLVTTFSVSAAPPNSVYVDASGNMLVGTATAFARLAVNGAAYIGAGSDLQVGNINNNNAASINSDSADTSAALVFKTAAAGLARAERMRIDANGNLIRSVNSSPPALSANQTMVASLPSDTQLRISVRGSDGVTRTANITLS